VVSTEVARRERAQVNLVLRPDSSIARRLRAAERVTGKSRTQIARAILEMFLDAWVATEISHQRTVDAVRARILTSLVGSADDAHDPAPDYRAYLEAARRFLDAPEGFAERELAGAELSAGLARDRGDEISGRGGELRTVRARIRDRQAQPAPTR
jgi:hypothetical protein